MTPTTVPRSIRRDVADAALGHALDALRDAREERDTWRDIALQALDDRVALEAIRGGQLDYDRTQPRYLRLRAQYRAARQPTRSVAA